MSFNINDADYHQLDAIVAARIGYGVRTSPWCECQKPHPGIVTCSYCGRMRMPRREPDAKK